MANKPCFWWTGSRQHFTLKSHNGVDEDRINSAVMWDDVQGSGTINDAALKWELGGNRGDVEGTEGVSPSDDHTDYGDEGKTCVGRRARISPGGGGTRIPGITPHTGVHLETAGNHIGTGGMPPHLWTLYWGGAEAGAELNDEMVGSRRGKLARIVDREYV